MHQGQVKWSSSPNLLATWEDLQSLRQRFPRAPAWGQAGSGRGDVVSTNDQDTELEGTKIESQMAAQEE
jgi:hypothetical protein